MLSSNASIFERTPVQAVETRSDGVTLTARGGSVRARQVVLATNAYTRELSFAPRRIVVPLWVTLVETEPFDPDRLAETGWTSGAGIYTQHLILESYRPTSQGTIVFGTRRVEPRRTAIGVRVPNPLVVEDVVRGFYARFPSLRDVTMQRTWGGWIAMTPSWLPVAAQAQPNVFYAVGYNGHGLAQAPYLGTLLADHVAGEAHDDLRTVWRERHRFAPAPLMTSPSLRAAWSLDRLSDELRRRCSRSSRG